jgi:hypothetical protein
LHGLSAIAIVSCDSIYLLNKKALRPNSTSNNTGNHNSVAIVLAHLRQTGVCLSVSPASVAVPALNLAISPLGSAVCSLGLAVLIFKTTDNKAMPARPTVKLHLLTPTAPASNSSGPINKPPETALPVPKPFCVGTKLLLRQ